MIERTAGRRRLGGTCCAELFQLPQDVDLRRLERDPAQHPRQGGAGVLNRLDPDLRCSDRSGMATINKHRARAGEREYMDFDLSDEQQLLKDSVDRMTCEPLWRVQDARQGYMKEPNGYSAALWKEFADLGLLGDSVRRGAWRAWTGRRRRRCCLRKRSAARWRSSPTSRPSFSAAVALRHRRPARRQGGARRSSRAT